MKLKDRRIENIDSRIFGDMYSALNSGNGKQVQKYEID